MNLINNILVAVDLSDTTENLINNCMHFAKKFNAKVSLIHVLPDDLNEERIVNLARLAAKDQLKSYNERLKKENIETGDYILAFGNDSEEVVLAAEGINANLIMIGSGEKLNNDTHQLGTTAGKIIRKSKIPVLVNKQNQSLHHIQNILCPVDFSEQSKHALNHAIAIARLFNAKLIILNVYSDYIYGLTEIDSDEVNQQRKAENKKELSEFLKNLNLIDVNYTTEIVGGSPAKKILEAIKNHEIDLLLMGTTGKSGINKILLGSVAEKVTREVYCSFITSKKESFLSFQVKAKTLLEYFEAAEKLYEKGFYKEAINLYNECLEINFAHLRSIKGLAKSYNKLGNETEADRYNKLAAEIIEQIQNIKIENEIRKNINK